MNCRCQIWTNASDCLQHKFGANCLNGRNLDVRTDDVQLDSVADTKLLYYDWKYTINVRLVPWKTMDDYASSQVMSDSHITIFTF